MSNSELDGGERLLELWAPYLRGRGPGNCGTQSVLTQSPCHLGGHCKMTVGAILSEVFV
jgi:hypothetical protein